MPTIHESIRAVAFELDPKSDGNTFEGYAAVFDSPAHIKDWAGEYDEHFAPQAFNRTLKETTPQFLFDHGTHPLIGKMPLGVFQQLQPDSHGLYVRARMSDNWLIQPVRDAIRDKAITGMSVNFTVPKGGDVWAQQRGVNTRTVTDATLKELGPVVFPAYQLTTASVRSALDKLTGLDVADTSGEEEAEQSLQQSAQQLRARELRIRGIIRG